MRQATQAHNPAEAALEQLRDDLAESSDGDDDAEESQGRGGADPLPRVCGSDGSPCNQPSSINPQIPQLSEKELEHALSNASGEEQERDAAKLAVVVTEASGSPGLRYHRNGKDIAQFDITEEDDEQLEETVGSSGGDDGTEALYDSADSDVQVVESPLLSRKQEVRELFGGDLGLTAEGRCGRCSCGRTCPSS